MRIACVQYGNYTEARRLRDADLPETYSGQRYTVDYFERFVAGHEHLVISLHAPRHHHVDGRATLIGVSRPPAVKLVPERFMMRLWAHRVIAHLERFRPTHLLLRCNDIIGCDVMAWANRRGIPVGVAIAVRFDAESAASIRFCRLGNHPNVTLVANHNRVATQTMIDCGLDPAKAVAWDLPPTIRPTDFIAKAAPANGIRKMLFAGAVSEAKGVTDLVAAIDILRRNGRPVELDICGDGPAKGALRHHAGVAAGWLRVHGMVGNSLVVKMMRDADLVVVPSRPEFPEGLPFVIQESLAVRTPLLLSDHPVFTSYFTESDGVRFFSAATPHSLAKVAGKVIDDPHAYELMSQKTLGLWQSIRCPLAWHDVLDRLKQEWTATTDTANTEVDESAVAV